MPGKRSPRPDSSRRGAAEFLRSYAARQNDAVPNNASAQLDNLRVAQALHKFNVAYEAIKTSACSDALGKDKVYLDSKKAARDNRPVHPLVAAHCCRLEDAQDSFGRKQLRDAFAAGGRDFYTLAENHHDGGGRAGAREEERVAEWYRGLAKRPKQGT